MSQTKLDNFVEDDIKVRLQKDADLTFFKEGGYCDYRGGCDICEKGNAGIIKINIYNIVNNSTDWFCLNDLDIVVDQNQDDDQDDRRFYFYAMYETTDPNTIKQLHKYYMAFSKLQLWDDLNILQRGSYANNGIMSKLEGINIKNISEVKYSTVCAKCYGWFICTHKQGILNFTEVNPFKYVWKDIVEDDLSDIIEFEDETIKKRYFDITSD